MKYIVSLCNCPSHYLKYVGSKAANLRKLQDLDTVTIPESIIVLPHALRDFIQHNLSSRQAEMLFQRFCQGNRKELLYHIAYGSFPETFHKSLDQLLNGSSKLLIVRSCAAMEDTPTRSLAGHYESLLTLSEKLLETIKKCWAVALRVYADYIITDEGASPSQLADKAFHSVSLLVQPAVYPTHSGVYFSQSPDHPGRSLISANWGSCHSIVDGISPCDEYLLDSQGIPYNQQIPYKFEMTMPHSSHPIPGQTVDYGPYTAIFHRFHHPHLHVIRVPPSLSNRPCLSPTHCENIHNQGMLIAKHLGYPVDVEWSYVDDTLYILQARPITTQPFQPPLPHSTQSSYTVASPGIATGPVRIVQNLQDFRRVAPGDIIAVTTTSTAYLPVLYRCSGILCENGSMLSHTAIVARELSKPCLIGVNKATRGQFQEGEIITLDANQGLIIRHFNNKLELSSDYEAIPHPNFPPICQSIYHLPYYLQPNNQRPVTLTLTALLYGYLHHSNWSPLEVDAILEYWNQLTSSSRKELRVFWNIGDLDNHPLDTDPTLQKLYQALPLEEGKNARRTIL